MNLNIKEILNSGRVVRYHAAMITEKQSNAEHSWEVATILQAIYPNTSKELLFYALTHDAGEIHTSDVASPLKRKHPEIKELLDKLEHEFCETVLGLKHPDFTKEEMLAVKYADILSGLYFTTRRANAGDKEAAVIRDRWIEYYKDLPPLNDACRTVFLELTRTL